ncbi:MAG: cytochrome c [Candidatus Roseilinea sp.]|uniref:cytochrome c n=1 Tax=Candidatus Roseilinea sp. TaxID=2838777 RepID=UPI00404B8DCA
MYPFWEGILIHSTLYVAINSAFHVLVSHLTVAAAWFNLYIERRAVRENREELYEYLKRSALGLLVFAYVFGALAGVGIWQTTTAANPRGISTLIHNFVFFWGAEWYMFLIDVIGIMAYYYTFGRVSRQTHLRLAWILALGSTGTLSIIVGVLSFKLTPGLWLETGNSLNGFFNPTFWPQLSMRFYFMFVITAAWVLFVATGLPKGFFEREKIIRYASGIGLIGLVGGVLVWLVMFQPALPQHALAILPSRAIPQPTFGIIYFGLAATLAGLLFAFIAPNRQRRVFALAAMVVMYGAIFGAERTREVLRKPDVIAGYISSNQLIFNDLPARQVQSEEKELAQTGMLGNLPFVPARQEIAVDPRVTFGQDDPELAVGRVLAIQQCGSCHSISHQTELNIAGVALDLRSQAKLLQTRGLRTVDQIDPYLGGIQGFPYMHPFVGTLEERRALAKYLAAFMQDSLPADAAQAKR